MDINHHTATMVTEFCACADELLQAGRHHDVLTIARYILVNQPDDVPALYCAARASRQVTCIEDALEYTARLLAVGNMPPDFPWDLSEDIQQTLFAGADCYNRLINNQKLHEALSVIDKMIRISPQAKPLIESALTISVALGDKDTEATYKTRLMALLKAEHDQLQQEATKFHEAGRYEDELKVRLAIFEHPYDLSVHNAWRLQNIHGALGCLFVDQLTPERQLLAKRLISAVPSPDDMADPAKDDMLGRFDKFYRLSIKAIDVDAIYGAPAAAHETSQMRFADSGGQTLTLDDIRRKVREREVQVGFFAAGTQPYFERCARYYIASVLNKCDVSCLVFVCATCGWDTAENVARSLGVDDERLIICTDMFDYRAEDFLVYTTNDIRPDDECPHAGTHYYACVGLLHLDMFIDQIGIPVFLSGMDTVLQRGVRDLLARFEGADIVVNRSPLGKHMSSTLVNSLQLIYPTNNALLFAAFLRRYFGDAVKRVQQHFAMDQLYLFMAMHHLLANGSDPRVEYFDEFDINNCMFNTDNVELCRDHLEKFRFVNIFHGGQADKALSGEQVIN